MSAKILITEFMDQTAVDDLSADYKVLYDPGLVEDPTRLFAEIVDADALIVRNRTQVRGSLLEAAKPLKAVGRLGVGLDNIDLAECEARAIKVFPASGANDLSVAEYVITACLVLFRGAFFGKAQMIAGDWPRQAMSGGEVSGRVLGLVGFGAIARESAKRALALGMRVAAFDPFVHENDPVWTQVERQSSLDHLLAISDALSLHVPLTPETDRMINAASLGKMKPGAVLINAARGGIVDEEALIETLKAGHLGGAALDVFANEPLGAEEGAKFEGLNNLILTPHIAGVTQESNVRVSALTAANIRGVLSIS